MDITKEVRYMISIEQLHELQSFDSATICNAIEGFGIRSRLEGFLPGSIQCMIDRGKPYIGYATTAKMTTKVPASPDEAKSMVEYYRYVQQSPRPGIAVIEDIDSPHVAAMWGDVMAHIHQACGSTAIVTNGGVRDVKEIAPMDFGCFASGVLCSHGYIHMLDFGCPVSMDGVTVKSGDLLFCDKEGIVILPEEIVPFLAEACRKATAAEWPVLSFVKEALLKNEKLDIEELGHRMGEMNRLRGKIADHAPKK